MSEVETGAAPAAAEGNAAPAVSTPEVAQVQVVEPARKSIEETMAEAFDKMNPPRSESGRFEAKDKPAETQEAETPAETVEGQTQSQASEPPKAIVHPNSLPAELRDKWGTVPPEIAEWAAKREAESHKRITELGETAKASEHLRQAIEKFRPSFKGVEPVQAIERLVAAGDFLERSPEEGLKWLANAYGVDLSRLASGQSTEGNTEVSHLRQQISQLQRQIADTSNRVQSREQAEQRTQEQSIAKLVEDFAKDEKRAAYWTDVENDVYEQIHAIKAADPNLPPDKVLDKAFTRALKLNEAVQTKIEAEKKTEIEKRAKAEAAKKAVEAKKAAQINVGRGASATPKPKGSWEETMREVGNKLMPD